MAAAVVGSAEDKVVVSDDGTGPLEERRGSERASRVAIVDESK